MSNINGAFDEFVNDDFDKFIIGTSVEVLTLFQQAGDSFEGYVNLNGARLKALCRVNKLSPGDNVIVKKRYNNLTLEVEMKS